MKSGLASRAVRLNYQQFSINTFFRLFFIIISFFLIIYLYIIYILHYYYYTTNTTTHSYIYILPRRHTGGSGAHMMQFEFQARFPFARGP